MTALKQITALYAEIKLLIPCSAAVAQLTVNQLVVGSNPTSGANMVCGPDGKAAVC